MRTSLLQNEKANIERMLEPIKNTWRSKGVSFYSDEWLDAQRKLIINFITVTESELMSLSSKNAEGFTKSKFYIADKLMEKVREIVH